MINHNKIKCPKQKKIMLLGGIHYLLPVIKAAHEQGGYKIFKDPI